MKKLFLLCAIVMNCALRANCADPATPDAKKVQGIYQLCVKNPENGKTICMPLWKIYDSDGTFVIFTSAFNASSASSATCLGTYEVRPDGVIVENIEAASNGFRKGDKNDLTYSIDGEIMTVSFTNKVQRKVSETWFRVCGSVDAERDAKNAKRAVKYGLAGLWQLRIKMPDGKYAYAPIYKNLGADGTFTLMNAVGERAKAASQGRYEAGSKKSYTEFVTATSADPDLLDRGNAMKWKRVDGDAIQVTFRMPGRSADSVEEWVRVVLP